MAEKRSLAEVRVEGETEEIRAFRLPGKKSHPTQVHAEWKVRIVLEASRGEAKVSDLCHIEWVVPTSATPG